jgi:hypothetical protein
MKRYDIYARIHKALRASMADTLVALGRMDPRDDCDVRETLSRLEDLLAFCESHVEHESAYIHAAIEALAFGSIRECAAEHAAHGREIDELRALASAVGANGDAAHRLYRRAAGFVAGQLAHMEREESENNALLWALFSDTEIQAIEERMMRAFEPGAAMQGLRWMIPSIHHGERVALFDKLRAAPLPVREGALALARTHLRPAEFRKLEGALAQREPEATLAS